MNFRVDRFLTINFFQPLKKRNPSRLCQLPILMYHGVSTPIKKKLHPYFETSTGKEVFYSQMNYLKENGYKTLELEKVPIIFKKKEIDEKNVVITFDDGLFDFYTTAFPVLLDFGFTATVFLPSGLMGHKLANQDVMSWSNARELSSAGVKFGSHSKSHSKLIDLEKSSLAAEIKQSKHTIEDKIGQEVKAFSYPYAFPEQNKNFVNQLESLLKESGYESGVTTIIGTTSEEDNLLFRKRLPINHYDDIPFFLAKLEGGYDWLRKFQMKFKQIKANTSRLGEKRKYFGRY